MRKSEGPWQRHKDLKAKVNPVRNSSGPSPRRSGPSHAGGALNPAGIILKPNPAAEQRGIISNGVKRITLLLEKRYGIPEREGKEDPLDILIQTILSQNT
ncbi:MAG: hypothetical protein MUO28_08735, partial [Desulfobacterales bacterium]|nr:hypothetical protein [Desulfobacterales bacterium]